MKRTLALLLVLVMAFSAVALTSCSGGKKTTTEASKPSESTPPASSGEASTEPTTSADNTPTPDDIMTDLKFPTSQKEHATADSLPSSSTLVGSSSLPTSYNRGDIDCMGSVVVTYMQFSNAVARYLASKNVTTWKPAEDSAFCFSPRYTYMFGHSYGVDYDILMHYGCLTLAQDNFDTSASGKPRLILDSVLCQKSVQWRIDTTALVEEALKYRLLGNESQSLGDTKALATVPLKDGGGFYDSVNKGSMVTYGTNGTEFMNKVKDAIATGNVVAIRGYIYDTSVVTLSSAQGLAKSGDTVINYFYKNDEVHYTSNRDEAKKGTDSAGLPYKYIPLQYYAIVGYDDSITVEGNGGKMEGAFQVYGTNPATGKDGFFFVSYDALNTISEDEGFDHYFGVDPEKETQTLHKAAGLDFVVFVYWDIHVTDTLPSLYAEVEVELTDRDAIHILAYRSDAFGKTNTFYPAATYYRNSRPNDIVGGTALRDYIIGTDGKTYTKNEDGTLVGTATTAYFVVNLDRLLTNITTDTDYKNYRYGISIKSEDEKAPITVKSIILKSGETELKKLTFTNETLADETRYYSFDFDAEVGKSYLSGNYYLQNAATGEYLIKDTVMTLKPGTLHDGDSNKCSCYLNISYNSDLDQVLLYRYDSSATAAAHYVLEALKGIAQGAALQFNAQKDASNATQRWNVSYNEDGTVTFYMKNEQGHNYALGIVDGQVCLVKAMELTDNIKWTATAVPDSTVVRINTFAEVTEAGVTISGTINTTKTKEVTIKVINTATGAEVASEKLSVDAQAYEKTLKLEKGNYIVRVYDATGKTLVDKAFSLFFEV